MWMRLRSYRLNSPLLRWSMKNSPLPRLPWARCRPISNGATMPLCKCKPGRCGIVTMAPRPPRLSDGRCSTSINPPFRWRQCGNFSLFALVLLTAWLGFGTISSFAGAVSIESVLDTADSVAKVGDVPNNAVRMNCVAGCAGGGGTSSTFGAAFPATGTAAGFSDGTNMQPGRTVDADTGAGTVPVQGVNLLKRASGGPVEAGTATDPLRVDPTGTTTQPVSGPLTDAQLRASPVPISGTVTATGPLTDAQLRATPVPVSGTVSLGAGAATIGALTANQSVNLAQVGATATVNGGLAGSLAVGGTAANNAAINQNPILVGCEAITYGTQPTAATTGNQRRVLCTTEGALAVTPGHNRFSCFVQAVTVTTQCQAAPGAGLRAYVLSIALSNQAATAQSPDIVFGTGANCVTGITALTHKFTMGTLATTTTFQVVTHTFDSPLVPTAANAICVRPSAATAFGATITGYIAP